MILLPIRTETPIRRTPLVNYILIALNAACFLIQLPPFGGPAVGAFIDQHLVLNTAHPTLLQFLTYQFLHGDHWHLLGNMICLWAFGNAVNSKMGNPAYLMFYLAGGVVAAWGYAVQRGDAFQLIGASGAIAAVTTAYLALFPRSRVHVLLFIFIIIQVIEMPAMMIIVLKIIVWDNIIEPQLSVSGENVAYGAHLAGYCFGFLAAMTMLWLRALARDQWDMLALWRRWGQRRALAAALSTPEALARARYGSAARLSPADAAARRQEEATLDELSALRVRINEAWAAGAAEDAASLYEQLMIRDPGQCLPERAQLAVARTFYGSSRFPQAAAAFERFLANYPASGEALQVRLLLGIIFARDLRRYEDADKHLTVSLEQLSDPGRREQCLSWLADVRAALGRPAPQA